MCTFLYHAVHLSWIPYRPHRFSRVNAWAQYRLTITPRSFSRLIDSRLTRSNSSETQFGSSIRPIRLLSRQALIRPVRCSSVVIKYYLVESSVQVSALRLSPRSSILHEAVFARYHREQSIIITQKFHSPPLAMSEVRS